MTGAIAIAPQTLTTPSDTKNAMAAPSDIPLSINPRVKSVSGVIAAVEAGIAVGLLGRSSLRMTLQVQAGFTTRFSGGKYTTWGKFRQTRTTASEWIR